jgi:hypothetical protein
LKSARISAQFSARLDLCESRRRPPTASASAAEKLEERKRIRDAVERFIVGGGRIFL